MSGNSSQQQVSDTALVSAERIPCRASWLGLIEYSEASELQRRLWQQKIDGQPDDFLLLIEHPPTLTFGKSGHPENLLVPPAELKDRGVSLFFTDRGGDVTYHGPGQLVAYPIFDLKRHGKDIHRYIFNIQECIIRTLTDYGVSARRDDKYVGVWVGNEKVAAIGVAVHKWVSMHGLALNIDPQMEHFDLINPCGIRDRGVTSLRRLTGHSVPVQEVAEKMARHFAEVFRLQNKWVEPRSLR